jgi:hypothetical protein
MGSVASARPRGVGELGQLVGDQRGYFGGDPPDHVVVGVVAVRVLGGQRGLADPAHAVQGLYHRRAVGSQRRTQPGEQVFTSGEGGVARGHVPHPPAPGPLRQRLEQRLAQRLRGGDRGGGQSAVREPGAERVLAGAVLLVAEQIRRALRLSTQQEHQPGQATLTRDLELQLRVGQLRPVAHRGSVPEPDDGHIDVGGQHRLPAHLLRALVPGGEIRHVPDGAPGPGDRLLRGVDERPASRKPPQLRGMTQEHPPWP